MHLPRPQTVLPRVWPMRLVEQVIYRAAQDPNSLNTVHELMFQTFKNELWHTTLKTQLPLQDIWHKSKIHTAWRGIRDHLQRGSDSPKVTQQSIGMAEIEQQSITFAHIGMCWKTEHMPFQLIHSISIIRIKKNLEEGIRESDTDSELPQHGPQCLTSIMGITVTVPPRIKWGHVWKCQ